VCVLYDMCTTVDRERERREKIKTIRNDRARLSSDLVECYGKKPVREGGWMWQERTCAVLARLVSAAHGEIAQLCLKQPDPGRGQ
jgi:hypothetical protein